ncbi:MAG: LysR family transcriptional regulator [Butyrivibrio sp.]|nr:LysR family transcriptional regulator [Muribaculum sp.]MCM1551243.1 LysR family transcriptional regulator [Butyrivibrio sp.]
MDKFLCPVLEPTNKNSRVQLMNLQQIKYVMYTAKHNSFSKAAKELLVTQPNVSSAIKDLEQELMIQIFERNKNGVSLTKEGVVLLSQLAPIMEQMGFIEDYYINKQEDNNILNVACQHCMIASKAVVELLAEHVPDEHYKVRFLEVKTKEVLRFVQEGQAEVGVLLCNRSNKVLMGEIDQRNLEFELIKERCPYVYISAKHPLAQRKVITSDELAPYPYVKYYQGENSMQFYSEEIVEDHDSDKTIIVTDNMTAHTMLEQLDAYTLGSGYKSMNETDSKESKVVVIPYDTNEVIELGIITSRERKLSPLCRQYIKKLKKVVDISKE